jgi:glycosyltransferase involved in cell wall biosynthesis
VGQITQRKGVSHLVEAFTRAGIPGSELLLVGRPHGAAQPWRGTRGLRHIDRVAPWETPALYRSADVFVLPAISEAFGRVVLEAMASGVPVIVSENTGAADTIEDGESGYVVPIRDADAIAERLLFLYEHPDQRQTMGEQALRQASRFTWAGFAEGVTSVVCPPPEGFLEIDC